MAFQTPDEFKVLMANFELIQSSQGTALARDSNVDGYEALNLKPFER